MTTTTTATVIPEGLALARDFMAEHHLAPGTRVVITVTDLPRKIPADIERLIEETCGMFAGGPSMADELIEDRREEDRRFNEKW